MLTYYSVITHIKKVRVFCLWLYKNPFHTKLWSNWKKVQTSWTLHSPLHISKDFLNICLIKWAKCCILLMNQYSRHHSLLLRTLGFFFPSFSHTKCGSKHLFTEVFFFFLDVCVCLSLFIFHRTNSYRELLSKGCEHC